MDGVEQINFLEPSIVVTPSIPAGELTFGMRGDSVKELQQLLAKVPSIYPEGIISGYFGSLTQAAVKRLQARYDLPQTGIADTQTRQLLSAPSAREAPLPLSTAETSALRPGAQGDEVKALQEFLKAQGVYPEGLISGFYGTFTYKAVLRFQKKYGIHPYDGFVAGKTREKIEQLRRE